MLKSISTIAVFAVLCICVQAYAGEGCQMTGMPSLCKEFIHQQFGGKEIVWDKYGGSGGYSAIECFGQVCGNKGTMVELVTVWKGSGLSNKNDIANRLISSFRPEFKCRKQSPIPALFKAFEGVIPDALSDGIIEMLNNIATSYCAMPANWRDFLKEGLLCLLVAYPHQNGQIKEAIFSHIFLVTQSFQNKYLFTKYTTDYSWVSEKAKEKYLNLPEILSVKWTGDIKHALRFLSEEDLRLYRNAVFAKHGRQFQDENLQKYFSSTKWYTINKDYTDNALNDIDKHNITTIIKIAAKRKELIKQRR